MAPEYFNKILCDDVNKEDICIIFCCTFYFMKKGLNQHRNRAFFQNAELFKTQVEQQST